MGKATHLSNLTVPHVLRVGGVGAHALGGQSVTPDRVPTNWFPVNLPITSAGTPQNSDVATLLENLSKLVALLTIQQSVFLGNCYRTVQSGIASGGTFSLTANGSTVTGVANSWFDLNIPVSEAVAVDVTNKNPSLTYDLALRLAVKAAAQFDKQMAAKYASFSVAAVGTSGTTPTPANLATQANALPNTGEPIIGAFAPATAAAYLTANPSQTVQNGGMGFVNPTGSNKLVRLLASDNIAVSSGNRNLLFLPSSMALVSTDMGTITGAAPAITPSGTVQIRASNFVDVEFGTQPQLSLQLVCGNTGSGVQTVYVNALAAALVMNAAAGAVVVS